MLLTGFVFYFFHVVLKIGVQELDVFYSLGEGVFKNGRDILGWSQGTGRQRDNCTFGVGHSGWDVMSGANGSCIDELGGGDVVYGGMETSVHRSDLK